MENIRTCIACGRKLSKEQLLRIAKFKDGRVEVSPRGGRGAYICGEEECLKKAFRGDRLAKALRIQGKIEADTLHRLVKELEVMSRCRKL